MGQLRDRMEQDLILRKLSPATRRNYLLYCRKFAGHYVPFPRRPRNDFPEVVNRDQLVQLFAALRSPKYRALFLTCYAAGLRISEACALRIEDLDSRFPALLATICVVRLAGGALCRPARAPPAALLTPPLPETL